VMEAKVAESVDHALHGGALGPVRESTSTFPDDDRHSAALQYRFCPINNLRLESLGVNFENNSCVYQLGKFHQSAVQGHDRNPLGRPSGEGGLQAMPLMLCIMVELVTSGAISTRSPQAAHITTILLVSP